MRNHHLIAVGIVALVALAGCTKASPVPQGPSTDAATSAETVGLKEVTLEVLGMT
jgi:hypothetical protein